MHRIILALALMFGAIVPASAATEIPNLMVIEAQTAARQGDFQTALDLYTRALDSGELNDTMTVAALNGRGLVYYRMREYRTAIADYSQALSIEAENPTVLRNRCFAFIELREWGYAFDDCRDSAALLPDDPEGPDTLGYLFLRQQRWDESIAYFNQAIAIDANYGPAYLHRGLAYYGKGDRVQGREDLLTAQSLMPGNLEVEKELRRKGLIP